VCDLWSRPARVACEARHVACRSSARARVVATDHQYSGEMSMSDEGTTRREVLKKAAYTTPVLVTLKANLALASAGSGAPISDDRLIPGGSGPTNPATLTPGNLEPPPWNPPPPEGSRSPLPTTAVPVNPELPPTANPTPDNSTPPPQDPPETNPGVRRRWLQVLFQWFRQQRDL
jgi:hypothetical protein